MNPIDVISERKQVANFFEVYHKTSFKCYRNKRNGEVQAVLVEIQDAGLAAGNSRYSCIATSDDGRNASGNPGPSTDVVLATMHWWELDE